MLGDDRRTFHDVTPIEAVDRTAPAHRDVLVLDYNALPDSGAVDTDAR